MQLYQLKPFNKRKKRKRVGRGGKKGTFSGRGNKGQKSRAGKKPRPGFAGGDSLLIKRMPKQRGQSGSLDIRKGVRTKKRSVIVFEIGKISKKFKEGEIISPQSLAKKGFISKIKGRIPKIKILGKLDKKLSFEGVLFSKDIKTEKKKKVIKKKTVKK